MSGSTERKLSFSVDVSRWVEQAHVLADLALRATAQDALARVKELTPVDTGYLRSNWTVIRPGDAMPVAGQEPDPMIVINELKAGDTILLVNPVEYARRIEFGFVGQDIKGRHYDQKGAGMMQQTIAEMPGIAERATERVLNQGTEEPP